MTNKHNENLVEVLKGRERQDYMKTLTTGLHWSNRDKWSLPQLHV